MPPTPLAAQDIPTGQIILWSAVLILILLGLFVFLSFYRKWMTSSEPTTGGPAFTLSDLRKLHKEGKMTTEEYEKAKAAIIGPLKTSLPDPLKRETRETRDPTRDSPRRTPPPPVE
jgi:hypothetical protein